MDLIKSEVAKKFLQDAFLAVGVPNDESAVMAESLLDANLLGYY
jgi:LDH2 family malate/lactate/ureidoglycolate dehydrogenase